MTTPSNLYAEKVFAEHPTAFWAMDGEADYLSLISDTNKNVAVWTASGATATLDTSDQNQPFTTAMSKLELASAPGSGGTYTFTSPTLFNLNTLDADISSLTFGIQYLSSVDNISKIEMGFIYGSTEDDVVEIATPNKTGEWQFISTTASFSNATSVDTKVFVRVTYTAHASQKATIYVNGVHVGVWSEEFLKTSGGQFSESLPASISSSLSGQTGVPINSYGDTEKTGYYLVSNNTLRARNTSIPMVFGAENSTSLLSNGTNPSLIIPGQGFLHAIGRNQTQTLEFWLRKNQEDGKIVGPITTENGLYAVDGSLVLRVGTLKTSYFVGEWSRPMLINIVSQPNRYSVLVNGEQVLELIIISAGRDLLQSQNIDLLDDAPDWLGFYGSSAGIEVDNIAIYPYAVSSIVAKRRFVYGQGVEYPLNVNSTYNGKSIFIDYRFANYSNNYSYPNIGKWNQGTYDNVVPLDNALSMPEYALPQFIAKKITKNYLGTVDDLAGLPLTGNASNDSYLVLSNGLTYIWVEETIPQWYMLLNSAQEWLDFHASGGSATLSGYFDFKPSDAGSAKQAADIHILFEKLSSVLNERVSGISGVFKIHSGSEDRTLIRVISRSSQHKLSIRYVDGNVVCNVYTGETIIRTFPMLTAPTDTFMVGIDIDKMSAIEPLVGSLFQNHDDVSVYVGSAENFVEPIGDASLINFGFSTKQNMHKNFSSNSSGVIAADTPTDNYASYRLTPIPVTGSPEYINTAVPDVQVTGYWGDYLPLSVLSKKVFTDSANTSTESDIDFIQFNLDSSGIETTWASFQYLSEGANATQASLTPVSKDPLNKNIILPDVLGWYGKRFEITNGDILYVPKQTDGSGVPIDFNDLAIVLHVEFKNIGVTYNPDIRIKSLEMAPQSLNHSSPNTVNTLLAEPIYPIVLGSDSPYKAQNPFRIYKSSTPYLYLSAHTGIELAGYGLSDLDLDETTTGSAERILRVLLSKSTTSGSLSSLQMAVRYGDSTEFPSSETKIFSLKTSDGNIDFYMERSGGTSRARIFAKKNGSEYFYDASGVQAIEYHLNGKEVKNPILSVGQWDMLGITFPVPLTISSSSSLDMSGPLLFNNISYYQVDPTKLSEQVTYSKWQDVDDGTWGTVDDGTWQDALISDAAAIVSIDPSSVYDVYLGTNKIIVDTYGTVGDTKALMLTDYEYVVYKDIKWQSQTILPT